MSSTHEALPRVLGLSRGLALSLGAVVGSGIFFFPAYLAQLVPDSTWFLAMWIVGGAFAMCTAFCYAELATLFPETGGYVVYLRRIYGDRLTFVYGWAAIFVIYPASVAGIARAFGRAATDLGLTSDVALAAAVMLAVCTALNVVGVVTSARLQVVFTTAKVTALLVLAALGLFFGRVTTETSLPEVPATIGVSSMFLAVVAIAWCFDGFLEIVTVAGEVKRPEKNLTRVLLSSVAFITLVYLLYAFSLLRHVPLPEIAASESIAAELARRLLGGDAGRWVNITILVSTASACLSLLLSGPRIVVGLARAGLFLPRAGDVAERTRTPAIAVVVCGVVAMSYAMVGTFFELVVFFEFATAFFGALIVGGGWWLRKQGRVPTEKQRIRAWPLPPVISLLGSACAVGFVLHKQPLSSLAGLAAMLIAVPLSSQVKRWRES